MMMKNNEGDAEAQSPSFSYEEYLAMRAQNERLLMVEFGHDALPVAFKPTQDFTSKRAYIGIEAWLRDPWGEKRKAVAERREERTNLNAFFLTQQIGGAAVRDTIDGRSYYSGNYLAETILPDASVSEVFASNVFGDPHVAGNDRRTAELLREMTRLIESGGVIIVRETITPKNVDFEHGLLGSLELTNVGYVTPVMPLWAELEALYRGDSGTYGPAEGAKYIFLHKTVNYDKI